MEEEQVKRTMYFAKRCAIIACDELIIQNEGIMGSYWEEVKKEIKARLTTPSGDNK